VHIRQQNRIDLFTRFPLRPTLPLVAKVKLSRPTSLYLRFSAALILIAAVPRVAIAQEPAQKPVEKPTDENVEKAPVPGNPAQIELLETRYRFEADGSSRKEVHTRVHINSELGVRQFARLNFDFNRAFQSIEIPLVHITHASGGTADILPSAITDNPNPAVLNAPAYQDVRVKTLRILGLEPGDTLEYRVITTTSHHPLAPDFWLDHSFDRTGVVSQEIFELDLPALLFEDATGPIVKAPCQEPVVNQNCMASSYQGPQIRISPETPEISKERTGGGKSGRLIYKWKWTPGSSVKPQQKLTSTESSEPDVVVTTFSWWPRLAMKLKLLLSTFGGPNSRTELDAKSAQIGSADGTSETPDEKLYRFVSQKIRTVDLPLGSMGFHVRPPLEVLSSGYGTAEDKAALFLAMLPSMLPPRHLALYIPGHTPEKQLPRPTLFTQILAVVDEGERRVYLDLAAEVAPFGVVPSSLRGTTVLMLNHTNRGFVSAEDPDLWREIPRELPFASAQQVKVDAALAEDGKLTAKVHYSLRGDNELLLRVAFHQSPKDKWKDLAQLLSLSDGFRGEVSSVSASDPYATREPFTLDYEITQPKFVDWSKKPVRIPALLPQLGLPDPPAKPAAGSATAPVELGTPLEVETHMTLHLPPGTTARTPTGIAVVRDYATFASQYAAKDLTVTASRHINFLSREVPADRAADYNAFLRAVLSDEAQDFTLERSDAAKAKPAPAAAKPPATKP
jgi:hypothetical protein